MLEKIITALGELRLKMENCQEELEKHQGLSSNSVRKAYYKEIEKWKNPAWTYEKRRKEFKEVYIDSGAINAYFSAVERDFAPSFTNLHAPKPDENAGQTEFGNIRQDFEQLVSGKLDRSCRGGNPSLSEIRSELGSTGVGVSSQGDFFSSYGFNSQVSLDSETFEQARENWRLSATNHSSLLFPEVEIQKATNSLSFANARKGIFAIQDGMLKITKGIEQLLANGNAPKGSL